MLSKGKGMDRQETDSESSNHGRNVTFGAGNAGDLSLRAFTDFDCSSYHEYLTWV